MDVKTSIQALNYISKKYKDKNGNTNKMAALKLLFFAEKYHLQQYARMITNDTFFAMKHGPVASAARDVLSFDNIDTNLCYRDNFISNVDLYSYKEVNTYEDLDMLSETDIEALEFALEKFGHLDEWQLVEETHKYKEWKRYENLFIQGQTSRKNIEIEDFFKNTGLENDPYNVIPQEIVKLSEDFYING